jgi:GNAT superfamily N-acetyltransferase
MTQDIPLPDITVESEPSASDRHILEEQLYHANVRATGIADGKLIAAFLAITDGSVMGGAEGWSWGGTCYVRHLFVPGPLRRAGLGTRLMMTIEEEARARGCRQIILDTYDFQAPEFYRRLGFEPAASVANYVGTYRYLTFIKRL